MGICETTCHERFNNNEEIDNKLTEKASREAAKGSVTEFLQPNQRRVTLKQLASKNPIKMRRLMTN